MVKKKNSTQSTKRYTYSSFKDRVEGIKINRPLLKSSHRDIEVEVSNFHERYEHWKEINITGNFTQFVERNESLFQTLPQLIYHKDKIYTELVASLTREDNIELTYEPLLDLLAAFVHDLGEDFYEPYYADTVKMLIQLSVAKSDNSNVLEWIFNCLGFIFKYLASELSKNLLETFDLLTPLFQYTRTKTYLSRFASEATSFLIKKVHQKNIAQFITATIQLADQKPELSASLIIMYTEAMTNINGTLHSKAKQILTALLQLSSHSQRASSIVCDVVLKLVEHCAVEAADDVYVTVLAFVSTPAAAEQQLHFRLQLLISLAFAQSGKKVHSWDAILDTVDNCLESYDGTEAAANNAIVQFYAVAMRNADPQALAKYHVKMFEYLISLNEGHHFLPFVETAMNLNKERVIAFGSKYVQEFLNRKWKQNVKEVALFISHMDEKNLVSALGCVLPYEFSVSLVAEVKSMREFNDLDDLKELYWKLALVKQIPDADITEYLETTFHSLLANDKLECRFYEDVVGLVLQSLASKEGAKLASVWSAILVNLDRFQDSTYFLKGVDSIIGSSDDVSCMEQDLDEFLLKIARGASSPSHEIRSACLSILETGLTKSRHEVSKVVSQCRVIESIPLALETARDIQIRTRSLATEFAKASVNPLEAELFPRFLFGMLTVKFSPSWKAASEAMSMISGKSADQLWRLALAMLTKNYVEEEADNAYFVETADGSGAMDESSGPEWVLEDTRLQANTEVAHGLADAYTAPLQAILQGAAANRSDARGRAMFRTNTLNALIKMPALAESHAESLVPILLGEDTAGDASASAGWSAKDRDLLVTLFQKFKNMRKIARADDVMEHMLVLLGHRVPLVQKSALAVILNYRVQRVLKYKDNLGNLLDDTLFRDELAKFVTRDKDVNILEDEDRDEVMPLVLRILFGRAQTANTSGMNRGKKQAVFSILPALQQHEVSALVKLAYDRIPFQEFFDSSVVNPGVVSEKSLKRQVGFVNFLSETIATLGSAFNDVLCATVEPLVYSLATAQYVLQTAHVHGESVVGMEKSARTVRSIGMRCLTDMFKTLRTSFDWAAHIDVIYHHLIAPRLELFAQENLQQPSSLLRLLVSWSSTPEYQAFLYLDGSRSVKELLALLGNQHTKDSVLSLALDFCLAIVNTTSLDERFIEVVSAVVESSLLSLSSILSRVESKEVNSKAITLLLALSENGYIEDYDTKKSLIAALSNAFDKPITHVGTSDKINILKSLSSIIENFDCSFDDVLALYQSISKSLRFYTDRKIRRSLCDVLLHIGERFQQVEMVSVYVESLNSYSSDRFDEPDFEKRLATYKEINDVKYAEIDPLSWLPLVYCALFFMNDVNELAIRTNATFMLRRFVDCFAAKATADEAEPFIRDLKNIILPALRMGLRSEEEAVRMEYTALLAHVVAASKYYHDLDDMKVLLFDGDEEANFFLNVNHIQIHRRQRAIRRLKQLDSELSEGSISHYLMPMIEHYAYTDDEKLRNVANESVETIGALSVLMSWNQFRAVLRRYISYLSSSKKPLRDSVAVVVSVVKSLHQVVKQRDEAAEEKVTWPSVSLEELEKYITEEILPVLSKTMAIRDDETIGSRIALSEAMVSLVICLQPEQIAIELPAILGSMCQIMKSRSEELRDVVRKNLGRAAQILGPEYLKFILQELKTALRRGPQIHVLSFTIHYLLVVMTEKLLNGDLDECAELIVNVIMEDAFGAAGAEKEAEGYSNKMKEIKHNKSFDTAEILASKVSLPRFAVLISPIKLLLTERIQARTQNKLDELLRRYSLGLNHNEKSSSQEVLVLIYQLHEESKELLRDRPVHQKSAKSQSEDHFLVKLDARAQKTQNEYSLYLSTLQKFALELLRVAISRNESLATTANLEGFVPLLEESLHTENEGVIMSSMRVLNLIVRLPFSESIDAVFKTCARRALNIVKDSPSTTSELSQTCLRFLATVIRHKSDIKLKDTALSYILTKIQPDLQEPNKQGLAFNFLKALVASHVMIAEVYDTMDKVAEIMITNHAREIRDMSRSVYFQFLMEFDQSRGRLEKQFKFLVNNLQYPTEKGRQSVMELLHLIINKAGKELLHKLSSSFFVSLVLVMISDDANRCREMATTLISSILAKLDRDATQDIEKFIATWMTQKNNPLLLRCGLQSHKLYISEFGLNAHKENDNIAIKLIEDILRLAKKAEEGDEVEWESVYSALTVLGAIFQKSDDAYLRSQKALWNDVVDALLYPHSWIRLASSRLVGTYVAKMDEMELTDTETQNIAYRTVRQLSAPGISEALGSQAVKNLGQIAMHWAKNNTAYVFQSEASEADETQLATHWMLSRLCSIARYEIGEDLKMNKKCAIRCIALMVQILTVDDIKSLAETVIGPLYNLSEVANEPDDELKDLSLEALGLLEEKIGVSEYTAAFSNVRRAVIERRQQRKAKRSQLAVAAPEYAAKRKMRKHERFREKRKNNKDENGLYKAKRKKVERMIN